MVRALTIAAGLVFVCTSLVFGEAQAQAIGQDKAGAFANAAVRKQAVAKMATKAAQRKAKAWAVAAQQGLPTRFTTKSVTAELMGSEGGVPIYFKTHNTNAAISTATDAVRNESPYNLSGAGFTVGVWDAGVVDSFHAEFEDRVNILDGAMAADHATHVGGTIAAAGLDPLAIGMAPGSFLDSYDWDQDLAEMTERAAAYAGEPGGLYVSNHSYGNVAGWEAIPDGGTDVFMWFGTYRNSSTRESELFGSYHPWAVGYDELCYNAPFYLPFVAAGNDRNSPVPEPDEEVILVVSIDIGDEVYYIVPDQYDPLIHPGPDGEVDGGYDTITLFGTAKNVMTVGAVHDAVSGGGRHLPSGDMYLYSGWGPADDGRIKPDIVANGEELYSTLSATEPYGTRSGTSMSTANASGSGILLVEQYHKSSNGGYMRASTLKGLICHTADDLGNPGPDYSFGWGLMNTQAAADLIRMRFDGDEYERSLYEGRLDDEADSATFYLESDGSTPIRATLSWTDPPGTPTTALDSRLPRLVNDLDLRITSPDGTNTYLPYKLDVFNPGSDATTGDNTVDNIEQIYIQSPPEAGFYEIAITHKGSLSGEQQHYSLITSGMKTVKYDLIILWVLPHFGIVEPQGGSFYAGEVVELKATPFPGYRLGYWEGTDDDGSVGLINQVTMRSKQFVTVYFKEIEPRVTVTAIDGSAREGAAFDTAQFKITRDGVAPSAMDIHFSMSGTADSADYTLDQISPVRMAAGVNEAVITLEAVDDDLNESTEQAVLTIEPDARYLVGTPNVASVNILDDDPLFIELDPTLDGELEVMEGSSTPLLVRLSAKPKSEVTINAARIQGDADFAIAPSQITIEPSEWDTWQTFTISAATDLDPYADAARIRLSSSSVPIMNLDVIEVETYVEMYTLSGTISAPTNVPNPLTTEGVVALAGLPGAVTLRPDGTYEADVPFGWSGIITPSGDDWIFQPAHRTYNDIQADAGGQDFSSLHPTLQVFGIVQTVAGDRLPNVLIDAGYQSTLTGPGGSYILNLTVDDCHTLTPSFTDAAFEPASIELCPFTQTASGQNFLIVREPTELILAGPNEISENSTAGYRAIARYFDGELRDITNQVDWYQGGTNVGQINTDGVYIAPVDVAGDELVSLCARFAYAGLQTVEQCEQIHVFDGNVWYPDADGDGYGDPNHSQRSRSRPEGYVSVGDDCDDNDPEVNPGAAEICSNGVDDDCSGGDAGCTTVWYRDADADGHGDSATTMEAVSPQAGYVVRGGDCDDNNPAVHPGADEQCGNGVDEDCNGSDAPCTKLWMRDLDGDGYGDVRVTQYATDRPHGFTDRIGDCDDTNANVAPGMDEVCGNGIDDDCTGGDAECPSIWYADADGDGFGDAATTMEAFDRPAGYVDSSTDCDDSDANVHPQAEEVCGNDIDDDCEGGDTQCLTDWFRDRDGDGFGDATIKQRAVEKPDRFVARVGDCNDTRANVNPDAEEICGNGMDEDCDGQDAVCPTPWYRDADEDGYGDPDDMQEAVSQPDGYVEESGDCRDDDASISPAAEEVCDDGIDNDCDEATDCADTDCLNVGDCTDGDGDGVADEVDTCPDTPTGTDVDETGCPVTDDDDDAGSGQPAPNDAGDDPIAPGVCATGMAEAMLLTLIGLAFISRGRRP